MGSDLSITFWYQIARQLFSTSKFILFTEFHMDKLLWIFIEGDYGSR